MARMEAVERLVHAYPRYSKEWDSIKKQDDFDPALPYSYMGNLALFLVGRYKADDLGGIDLLFQVKSSRGY